MAIDVVVVRRKMSSKDLFSLSFSIVCKRSTNRVIVQSLISLYYFNCKPVTSRKWVQLLLRKEIFFQHLVSNLRSIPQNDFSEIRGLYSRFWTLRPQNLPFNIYYESYFNVLFKHISYSIISFKILRWGRIFQLAATLQILCVAGRVQLGYGPS